MKLQLFRHSGLPINLEDLKAFRSEYQERYDAAQLEAGPDMAKFQQLAEAFESELQQRYNQPVYAELPKNVKQWKALVETYGGDPIMVGKHAFGPHMILIIMDQF